VSIKNDGHYFCGAGGNRPDGSDEALTNKLKLKVNEKKSAVARPWERKFLGYSVTWHKQAKLKIALTSVKRLKEKVRSLTTGNRSKSVKATINALTPVLRGWISYFRLREVRGVLEELDGWIKRKLRCLLWRQWKSPGTRTKNLQRAGLSKDRAMISAYTCLPAGMSLSGVLTD